MKREIKFRGKSTNTGKFVYGFFGYDWDSKGDLMPCIQSSITEMKSSFTNTVIDINTLSQFTGLTDKNGKDIYDGDVVKFHYFYMSFGSNMGAQESEHELSGVVKWQEYGYGLDAIKGEHWAGYTGYSDGEGYSDFLHLAGMSESSVHEESFEIIGNIYETPELLNPT